MSEEELQVLKEEMLAIMCLAELLKDASEANDSPGAYHCADVISK